jgi:ABC-2 type transport system ATP-binding protein
MTPVISTSGLSKHFRKTEALHGLNLEVAEGSIFGLIGPNGAGKTTTLKTLMNIYRPDSGRATVIGVDSRRLGPAEFARIGYVSENQELPEWMTVEYFLSYLKPFYPAWDDARAAAMIRQFELPLNRQLKHLSRGMKMKAALVSSLSYRPKLLVLDEPFSGLDPMVREDLSEALIENADETSILVSSHDLGDIESFASHIGYIENGKLRFAEEMASLTSRFREVEVTVESGANGPQNAKSSAWPSTWLRPDATPAVVRFVESQFDPERTPVEIRRIFGDPIQISVTPMPLRSIFVTLARSGAATAA